MLNTALAQASLKKAMELGQVGANIGTVMEDNVNKLSQTQAEIQKTKNRIAELKKLGAGVNLGGVVRQETMSKEEVERNTEFVALRLILYIGYCFQQVLFL